MPGDMRRVSHRTGLPVHDVIAYLIYLGTLIFIRA